MTPHFIKHRIRPQDSLSSLASRTGMTEEELKIFHNRHCGKMDRIWFGNLTGIEFILIPTLYLSEEEQKIRRKNMLPPAAYFSGFHATEYLVSETFGELRQKNPEFKYTVQLTVRNEGDGFTAELSAEDFRVHSVFPEDKVSSLSLDCMKSISPVSFRLSAEGNVVSCSAHQSTVEKFRSKRKDLEEFHTGELSEKYLDTFEDAVSDEPYFFRRMHSCLWIRLLFPDLKWFHQQAGWKEEFFIHSHSFPLRFHFHADHFFEDAECVETKITGILSEPCSLRELLKGTRIEEEDADDLIQAEIQIRYFTYKTTGQLYKAESCVSIRHQDRLFQKHLVHLTQK